MIHRLLGVTRTLCGLPVEGIENGSTHVVIPGPAGSDGDSCSKCEKMYSDAVAESRARSGYVTVHALFHGLPLCGYGEGKTPSEWPVDQAWLAVTEIGRHKGKDSPRWCEPCLVKARVGNLPAAAAGTNVLDHMREPKNPDDGMRRFEVWSLRTIGNGGIDVRVGRAIENRDGSLVLELPDLGVKLRLKPS